MRVTCAAAMEGGGGGDMAMTLDVAYDHPSRSRRSCDECPWSKCRFSVPRVRAYLIAYREAEKHGDDPADYIRDCVRPSRIGVIEPLVRGSGSDPHASLDVKLSLELARDQGGIALNAWNAERVAAFLCARSSESPRR